MSGQIFWGGSTIQVSPQENPVQMNPYYAYGQMPGFGFMPGSVYAPMMPGVPQMQPQMQPPMMVQQMQPQMRMQMAPQMPMQMTPPNPPQMQQQMTPPINSHIPRPQDFITNSPKKPEKAPMSIYSDIEKSPLHIFFKNTQYLNEINNAPKFSQSPQMNQHSFGNPYSQPVLQQNYQQQAMPPQFGMNAMPQYNQPSVQFGFQDHNQKNSAYNQFSTYVPNSQLQNMPAADSNQKVLKKKKKNNKFNPYVAPQDNKPAENTQPKWGF